MKDLLDKVRKLNRAATKQGVQDLIAYLGETPSIAEIEEVLKYYKNEERAIRTRDLLEWMQENDLEQFENDEVRVSISTYVSAKVKDADSAFSWLISNGYGDLIKDSLDFPRGELSEQILEALEEAGASYTKTSGIHPQSLKKIISDRLKAGEDLPDEDSGINVNYFDECKIKEK